MSIHVVSLPHTETTHAYDWCAYTAKVRRFATMLHDAGHDVRLYGGERNEARCTEHVPIVSPDDWAAWFPDWTHDDVWPGWTTGPWWDQANLRAAVAIRERAQPGDVLALIAGTCQAPIAAMLPDLVAVEWGVGYEGVFAAHRVYESYAWMHHVAGLRQERAGNPRHAVIPNSFDPADLDGPADHDGYLLYLGRMTPLKGLATVGALAAAGHRVITAGQGPERVAGAEHLGVVLGDDKAKLLARARAVLAPTEYLEPFGGVAVEAMMSGAPVITTDWGAFTETVDPGVTGFRCRTTADFLEAAARVDDLDREAIASRARARWSTAVVAGQYDAYLRALA